MFYLLRKVLPCDPLNGVDLRFINLCPFFDEVFFISRKEYGESGKRLDFNPPWKCTQLPDLDRIDRTSIQDEDNVWVAGDYESFCTLRSLNVACIVYDGCDSQSLYFKRRYFYLPARCVLKRANAIRWYLIWLLRERKIAHYSRGVVVPADEDAKAFSRWKNGSVLVVSNGTKRIEELPVRRVSKARSIMFHGAFSWPVNVSCAQYLAQDVFPAVCRKVSDAQLRIAGHPVPEKLRNLPPESDVTLEGFVDNLRLWLSQCGVYVMPMHQGGGVKNKLLEAMAMGLPIVTNSMGAEAMDQDAKDCITIANGTSAIADAVVRLLEDPNAADVLGMKARQYAIEHFDWSKLADKYRKFLMVIREH